MRMILNAKKRIFVLFMMVLMIGTIFQHSNVAVAETKKADRILSAGGATIVIQKDDGSIWTWNIWEPKWKKIQGIKDVKTIRTNGHILMLKDDGTIWSSGGNSSGELGIGADVRYLDSARQITTAYTLNGEFLPFKDIVDIGAGSKSSFALNKEGKLWFWGMCSGGVKFGNRAYVPIPYETGLKDIAAIHTLNINAGYCTQQALTKKNGSIYIWGPINTSFKQQGESTVGILNARIKGFKEVGSEYALKNDGTVWLYVGGKKSDPIMKVKGLTSVRTISDVSPHTLALRKDGTVWAWGKNDYGELGDGTTVTRTKPIKVKGLNHVVAIGSDDDFSVAMKSDGTVWFWGRIADTGKVIKIPKKIGTANTGVKENK